MATSRIFVSYACTGDERGSAIGKQLVKDIRANYAEAVADHELIPEERFMAFLNEELPQCSYLIFVQTPASLQSLRVQTAVNMALLLTERRRLRGVLRVIATPLPDMDTQPLLSVLRTFDASIDYPRARDQLFIELGLITLPADDSILVSIPLSALQGAAQAAPAPQPKQSWLATSTLSLKKAWQATQALLARPLKTSQTTIPARPFDAMETLRFDRPHQLIPPRRAVAVWGGVIGMLLLLALLTVLIVVLVYH